MGSDATRTAKSLLELNRPHLNWGGGGKRGEGTGRLDSRPNGPRKATDFVYPAALRVAERALYSFSHPVRREARFLKTAFCSV